MGALAKLEKKPPKFRSRDDKKSPKLAIISNRFNRALERESRHILTQSAAGKLDKNSAVDLVNYMKLLKTLEEDQKKAIEEMSEEEILEALDKHKNGNS